MTSQSRLKITEAIPEIDSLESVDVMAFEHRRQNREQPFYSDLSDCLGCIIWNFQKKKPSTLC